MAWLFLKLGTIAFGGPAAHIAMMEEEVVTRRRWLTREEFLDYLGATNLIPGPNSTELAIHIGRARAGRAGLIVAGVCFIVPAALIVSAIAWAYVRWGELPAAQGVLYGVKPVVIAIVLQALWRLGPSAVKSNRLAALGAGSVAAIAAGTNELLVLLLAGLIAGLWQSVTGGGKPVAGNDVEAGRPSIAAVPASAAGIAALGAAGLAGVPVTLWTLFIVFAKIGSVLFGSGYVLLAFLRADFVTRLGWLTEQQLLDAVAVGQVTPGPVFTTATFVGYVVGGWAGAAVATVGIFLPAFVFVALSGPLIPRIRRSEIASAALDAVIVASLALMAVVSAQLARAVFVDIPAIVIAMSAFVLLARYRVGSAWLVAGGALLGLILTR